MDMFNPTDPLGTLGKTGTVGNNNYNSTWWPQKRTKREQSRIGLQGREI